MRSWFLIGPVALAGGAACRDPGGDSASPPASAKAAPIAAPAPSGAPPASVASASPPPAVPASAPPFASAPPATTGDAAAPVGGNWLRCYSRFQPRTEPRLDVLRLGLLCGPANGMRKLSDPQLADVSEGGAGREHAWQAEAGDCFRIFAVADPSVPDLDIEVFGPSGSRVAFDTTDDRWPVVNPDGPFCVFDAGEYRARVKAQRGAGQYAIQIWRLR